MSLVTDPSDPRLSRGVDNAPVPQNEAYLVLSQEERDKGFVRPLRDTYVHVGPRGPKYPLRDLTPEEKSQHSNQEYVKYEAYPESEYPIVGRSWTQKQLDEVGKGCGGVTTMGLAIAETYARDPKFYGSTYCVGCRMHRAVGEFRWKDTDIEVGA
jgi:hypothetical protein